MESSAARNVEFRQNVPLLAAPYSPCWYWHSAMPDWLAPYAADEQIRNRMLATTLSRASRDREPDVTQRSICRVAAVCASAESDGDRAAEVYLSWHASSRGGAAVSALRGQSSQVQGLARILTKSGPWRAQICVACSALDVMCHERCGQKEEKQHRHDAVKSLDCAN